MPRQAREGVDELAWRVRCASGKTGSSKRVERSRQEVVRVGLRQQTGGGERGRSRGIAVRERLELMSRGQVKIQNPGGRLQQTKGAGRTQSTALLPASSTRLHLT